ncbi:MAG: C_GCAxxG_C_C family protein [Candidatus Thorarchaeota archaeon]|nr:MAG: C_GCAxxG_C_C family protein [Candidatus Thorarchaeota archaeon]
MTPTSYPISEIGTGNIADTMTHISNNVWLMQVSIVVELNGFESLHGSTICRELINHDLISDEDVSQAFKTGAFDNCSKYVEDTSELLEKLL